MKGISKTQFFIAMAFLVYQAVGWCVKATFTQTGGSVSSIDYSPDGKMIATGGMSDNSVHILDAATFNYKVPPITGGNGVYAIKFSHNSALLAIAYGNGTVAIANTATGAITTTISTGINSNMMKGIDFNNDSTMLATCSSFSEKQLKVWYINNGSQFGSGISISSTSLDINDCQFTYDNKLLIAYNNESVTVLNSPYGSGNVASSINYNGNDLQCLAYRWDTSGIYYITGSSNRGFASPSNSSIINSSSVACAYSRQLDYFVLGGSKVITFFNATSRNNGQLMSITFSNNVLTADFSNDGTFLVVGDDGNTVSLLSQNCNFCETSQFFNTTSKICQLCVTYIPGCASCYNGSTCYYCFHNYYLSGSSCTTCLSTMPGCGACLNSSYCTSPMPGYYITTSNLPALCLSAMPGCQICNSSNYCFQCYNQYYLSSNLCVSCLTATSNCLKCLNSSFCTQCVSGYYAPGTGGTCTQCFANCLNCINGSSCQTCAVGYYYASGSSCTLCNATTVGCIACNNSAYCYNCMVGTYLTAGACTNCTAPCLSCVTSAGNCLSCVLGYYLSSFSCLPCSATCQTCNVSTTCLTCIQGYYLNGTNYCVACNTTYPNCQSCTSSVCTLCYTGFYNDTTTSCKSCGITMHACVLCNSSSNCLYCAPGHYRSGGNCQPCSSGCATCVSSSNCSSCSVGYYYSSDSCTRCSGNCATCTSTSSCLSCVIGYYLNNTSCLPCNSAITGCVACINNTLSSLNCTQCGVGLYLTSSGSCSACGANCVTCVTSATTCLSCPLGYYLNISDSTCMPCSPFCASCTANATCTSCTTGHYLAGTSCNSCPNPCVTCDSIPKCLSCDAGYFFISGTQTCQMCTSSITNCLFCNSSTYCYQCAYGYYLSAGNTSCTSCSALAGCYQCSSGSTCLACQSGYYLNGVSCSACPEGCIVCQNGTFCLSCATSYYKGTGVDNGKCLRCINALDGCQLCTNSSDCTDCLSGYYMDISSTPIVCKMCEVSLPYCQICNSSSLCTNCKGGYYLASNNTCDQCSNKFSSCQLCDRTGSVCTSCQSGYYLSGGNCLICSAGLNGCQICNSSSVCVQCQSGYYLSTGNICLLCQSTLVGCIFCSSSSVCLSCDAGYYLSSNTCHPCAVIGCEICLETNASACVTCNSLYFKSSATECSLCRSSLSGCLTCSSSSTCSKCDVGYYLTAGQCSLCSDVMEGCSICSSSTTCLQCKSMYFLNGTNQCQICSQPLNGCVFCTNQSACLSCGSGFFMNGSKLCQACTDLTGCLVCKDGSTCLFCDTGYYLTGSYTCSLCSIISGCYSCISSSVCTSCVGGYTLNTNSGCDVTTVQAIVPTNDLILKTFYVDSSTLKHYLYAKDMTFTKANLDWAANVKLHIMANNGTVYNLVLKSVEWSTENNYTIIFYTDNPINYEQNIRDMPFVRRLLRSSLDLSNFKSGIQLTDAAAQMILPNYQHSGSLLVNYALNNPQFYQSYISVQNIEKNFPFFVIGAAFVTILFLKYLLKALGTAPNSPNMGNIMPHILAFKVGALLLYPTYLQYINYCSGFMYADFPWLNKFFGTLLADARDTSPAAYSIFYINMNLASMYLLALCVIVCLVIVGLLVGKSFGPKYQIKTNAYFTFLYNFFVFGVTFAGCASLQGAIKNPVTSLNVNGIFYIIGILLYFSIVCECIYKITLDKTLNFWKIRVFIKATLLSLSHLSPIYLLSSTVVIDLVLVIVEYKLCQYPKQYKKSWIFANVMVNLALILLVFLPIIILTLVIVSASLLAAIVAEAIMHYLETRNSITVGGLEEISDKQKDDKNVWDLNINDTNEKNNMNKNMETSYQNLRATNATGINNEPENDNLAATFYPKDTDKAQMVDIKKSKRQRNYKKAWQGSRNKLLKIEDFDKKNSKDQINDIPNQNNQQNLTFIIEDILHKNK